MRDLMDHTLRQIYPNIDVRQEPSITSSTAPTASCPRWIRAFLRSRSSVWSSSAYARMLKTLVSEVGEGTLQTKDGTTLSAHIPSIWAGGVKTNPIVAAVDAAARQGREARRRHVVPCRGRDDVLALGDAAHFEQDGKALPMLAQVAVLEAPAAASNSCG